MATAAVALTAVVLVGLRTSHRGESTPAGRTEESLQVQDDVRYRAASPGEHGGQDELTPLSPLPGASIIGPQTTFSWSARSEADRYIVTVLDSGGAIVATIEARAPSHSADFTWKGPRPATLLWRVKALQTDRLLSESRPVAFELR